MDVASAASSAASNPLFAKPAVTKTERSDGSIIVRSTTALRPYARCVGDWLEHWARRAPDRVFLAERTRPGAPWRRITYQHALDQVRGCAAWMLSKDMSAIRPLAILSDNSTDHALLALAAMHVGVPVSSISPAYSLTSRDFEKLKSMIQLLAPGAIYVSDLSACEPALSAIRPLHSAEIICGDEGNPAMTSFRAVATTASSEAVDRAFAIIQPETIAKFLFTSGSTGAPKAVINTQRMLTASQEAKAQIWPFVEHEHSELVLLDWLP